jgi:serine kinase of HPr protein (carbohydrate metabolism regulator)
VPLEPVLQGHGFRGVTMETVHATCVSLNGKGVLLRGDSGSGKSDLALRLIDRGALLVADDLVHLTSPPFPLPASRRSLPRGNIRAILPPHAEAHRGIMEIRGLGLMRVPHADGTILHLVIDLAARVERYPEPKTVDILGVMISHLILNAFEASAVAKVIAALEWDRIDG